MAKKSKLKFPVRKSESVKVEKQILDRYRKLSEHTMIPLSMLIEKAMENSAPMFQDYGDSIRQGMQKISEALVTQAGKAVK